MSASFDIGDIYVSDLKNITAYGPKGITEFIDELTNWFIRRSRRRFWKSEDDQDKAAAYNTLFFVLTRFNRILSPFLPLVTETIYQNLERAYDASLPDSVHLTRWPAAIPLLRDIDLEQTMQDAREIVTIALSLRNEGSVRVRQPLRSITVCGLKTHLNEEIVELILDELNIKELHYTDRKEELFSLKAKADFKKLGPRLGKNLKVVADAIAELEDEELESIVKYDVQ